MGNVILYEGNADGKMQMGFGVLLAASFIKRKRGGKKQGSGDFTCEGDCSLYGGFSYLLANFPSHVCVCGFHDACQSSFAVLETVYKGVG